jgi:hypothetical protein
MCICAGGTYLYWEIGQPGPVQSWPGNAKGELDDEQDLPAVEETSKGSGSGVSMRVLACNEGVCRAKELASGNGKP